MNHQHVGNSDWGPSMGLLARTSSHGMPGLIFPESREQGISKVPPQVTGWRQVMGRGAPVI